MEMLKVVIVLKVLHKANHYAAVLCVCVCVCVCVSVCVRWLFLLIQLTECYDVGTSKIGRSSQCHK
jgi:hypothetical protein